MAIMAYTDMNRNNWYKLDNAAKIYPAISGPGSSSIFRVAVLLKQDVDPQVLQEALKITAPRFPTLSVRMKKGLFWYFFESNPETPMVTVEKAPPCRAIKPDENNGYLFRVSYYKKRISLEVFHALTDGTGALVFLKTLVSQYLMLKGYGVFTYAGILDCEDYPSVSETEDSFRKYSGAKSDSKWKEEKAYHVYGTKMPSEYLEVVHGIIPLDDFIKLARESNVTLTMYIAALIIYSIYSTQLSNRKSYAPVKVSIPVNLRQYFPSKTLRNFSAFVNVGINFSGQEYTFEQILNAVSETMKSEVQPDKLIGKISANVKAEKNIFMRLAPLVLKNVVLRTAYNAYGENQFTCSFSNLGAIKLPEEMEQYIERFEFVLGAPASNLLNCTACSFKDDLIITFTKMMHETDLERFFFRYLTKQGLSVTIETNRG
jgi:NRPS condensation-like uncharacterized protein